MLEDAEITVVEMHAPLGSLNSNTTEAVFAHTDSQQAINVPRRPVNL